ncbi:hypothetical protein [uncultured Desulfosarcina sp.]|uniref:hypothetical protein n=1 Tax=uncultured Desulfosarcina sp. TaxID=218289 RepID=UPI0029C9763A|nr:hypothetical protein [uncultured Desulfosarcina sp.]
MDKQFKPHKVDISELIDDTKKRAERHILRAYYNSVFEMSAFVDKLATWMLAGIGATAALTVTNIKNITAILPLFTIKINLSILTISALFGFLAKFLSLDIQSTVAQELRLRAILKKSADEYHKRIRQLSLMDTEEEIDFGTKVDIEKVLNKFVAAHPWYKRMTIRKYSSAEEAQAARLKRYYRQLAYTVFEFLGFLAFIIIVLFSI